MNTKELEQFVELLYPYVLKKLKKEGFLKNVMRAKNATVVSVDGNMVNVKFPYDSTSFSVLNDTGVTLKAGDVVCITYWIDLKNAVAERKVN